MKGARGMERRERARLCLAADRDSKERMTWVVGGDLEGWHCRLTDTLVSFELVSLPMVLFHESWVSACIVSFGCEIKSTFTYA